MACLLTMSAVGVSPASFQRGTSLSARPRATAAVRVLAVRRGAQWARRGALCVRAAQAGETPCSVKLVGMGGVGADYLAEVDGYPKADDKIRSLALEVQGGGNAGNALTAASRLGLDTHIITKVGDDGMGDTIIKGLEDEGIVTGANVVRSPGSSPFTYIIVDRTGGTRTCIHTPGPELVPEELPDSQIEAALAGAALVYFDGRLTETAINVAAAARRLGVPVLVEAERLRPHLEKLLTYADYCITSKHFPQDWTAEPELGDAMLVMLAKLPNLKFLLTTLGTKGSALVERCDAAAEAELTDKTLAKAVAELMAATAGGADGEAATAEAGPHTLRTTEGCLARAGDAAAALKAAALEAAKVEAAKNADAANYDKYIAEGAAAAVEDGCKAKVTFSSSWPLDPAAVVDTTGAGDSFIGSCCYALCAGLPRSQMLQLASYVAATKCRSLGPRPGLPHWRDVPAHLLQ